MQEECLFTKWYCFSWFTEHTVCLNIHLGAKTKTMKSLEYRPHTHTSMQSCLRIYNRLHLPSHEECQITTCQAWKPRVWLRSEETTSNRSIFACQRSGDGPKKTQQARNTSLTIHRGSVWTYDLLFCCIVCARILCDSSVVCTGCGFNTYVLFHFSQMNHRDYCILISSSRIIGTLCSRWPKYSLN